MVVGRIPKAKFIIIGAGPQERMLKEMVVALHIEENIKFLGSIPNEKLPALLTSMDVYVSTSLSDAGIAASTAEAMACGLPVVITDSGENRKWVTDSQGGYIVPVKSPILLSEKILYLLENEGLRKEYGMINRKTIIDKNDYFTEMGKMEKIYEEMSHNKHKIQ